MSDNTNHKYTDILIISAHKLFGHGLANLLSKKVNYNIIGFELDLQSGLQKIKQEEPDVVIIDIDEPPHQALPFATKIMEQVENIKVIGLSLHSNCLQVYQGRASEIIQEDDLIQAISNNYY